MGFEDYEHERDEMVDWRKIEMPLPEIVKYAIATTPVLALLLTLCIQVGSYKDKVDTLIKSRQEDSQRLYQQSQDINEIKLVLKIRSTEPLPQAYTLPEDPAVSKSRRPELPQLSTVTE